MRERVTASLRPSRQAVRSKRASRRRAPARSSITPTSMRSARCRPACRAPSSSSTDRKRTIRNTTSCCWSPFHGRIHGADVVLLNGSSTPAPREMRAGQRYRLRFINVHTFRPNMRMRLLRDSTLLRWRGWAKDGMDLPPDQHVEGPSEIQMGNGETYDFDFVPSGPGDIRLDITNAGGVVLVSMPIRVR